MNFDVARRESVCSYYQLVMPSVNIEFARNAREFASNHVNLRTKTEQKTSYWRNGSWAAQRSLWRNDDFARVTGQLGEFLKVIDLKPAQWNLAAGKN